jgi:phosphoserine phosphatase RsbU/P
VTVHLVVDLVRSMAVVIVVAYLFTRTRMYRQVMHHRLQWQGRLALILIFGVFSIWGTLSGIEIMGGIANTRDLGAALGGLLGGPVVGVGAGIIGGLQRLAMGGYVAVPSAIGAVLAGLAGGVVYLICGRRIAPVWAAALLAVFTESVLMAVNLAIARPFDQVLDLVKTVTAPMIIVNALGMALFVFIVRNEERERLAAAQKERIEGELSVARDIQHGIVPAIFPPFPERSDLDLYATLAPAREVGGDLYDFFLRDDDQLCLAVGDVSGKGVPASLFMAVTITLLREVGHRDLDPAEVLRIVNAPLCRDNDRAMFVTLFFAVCDVKTGALAYSTGGHCRPILMRDGRPELLPRTGGAGLGVSERIVFETGTAHLKPGDSLVLYSDGVTEAMNAHGAMFGEERLLATLSDAPAGADARQLLEALHRAVLGFAGGAEQSDDITLVAFRRTAVPATGAAASLGRQTAGSAVSSSR